MKGDERVIEILNDVLCAELTAVNQYFIHGMMCGNWRYKTLAKHGRDESIDEMKHAQLLIERILYLDGVPNMQKSQLQQIADVGLPNYLSLQAED